MADFDQNTYQPMDGDLYIQEVRTGRFTMYRYSFGSWEQLGAGHSEQDIKTLTEPLQFLGESKGFRRYYRPGDEQESSYWRGYHKAEEDYRVKLEETLLETSERLDELTASIALLRETMDTSIRHLASHVSHLALQISIDHEHNEVQP